MDQPMEVETPETQIRAIPFVSSYVDDFAAAYKFYSEILGLEKQFDMGPDACFFKVGDGGGLYLEGNNERLPLRRDSARSSFTLGVESAGVMFNKLKSAGISIIQDAPMDMSYGNFWFQFHDPAGNILEVLGGE